MTDNKLLKEENENLKNKVSSLQNKVENLKKECDVLYKINDKIKLEFYEMRMDHLQLEKEFLDYKMEKDKEEEFRMLHIKCFHCNNDIKINSRHYNYCSLCEFEYCNFCDHHCYKRRKS